MRTNRIEKADALAAQIGKAIARRDATQMANINHTVDSSRFWKAVREFKKHPSSCTTIHSNIKAHQLNTYYATVSTNKQYKTIPKNRGQQNQNSFHSVNGRYQTLGQSEDHSNGLNRLLAWFIRLGAPFLSGPLMKLFDLSLSQTVVPNRSSSTKLQRSSRYRKSKFHFKTRTSGRYQ